MRILYIITGLNSSGAELMLYKICTSLSKEIDITVISLTNLGNIGINLRKKGIPVIFLSLHKSIFKCFFKIIHLFFLIRKNKPDIVHTWMYHADLIGGILSKIAGVKTIVWCIRNSNYSNINTKLTTRLVIWICAKISHCIPSKIVSCSYNSINFHKEIGYSKNNFIYIPNGVDTKMFYPSSFNSIFLKKELSISKSKRLIGIVGRFDPQKNHIGFIKCAYMLNKKYDNLVFIYVGKYLDKNNADIINEISNYNLSEIFYLLGERNDIPYIMSSLDILVSPSIYGEAFPNVIAEAMSAGVPCVVTDVGDSSLIVGPSGITVPPHDYQALYSALSNMLNKSRDDYKYLAHIARDRVINKYNITNITECYLNLYKSCIL